MAGERPSTDRLVALVAAALRYKALGEHARTGRHLWVDAHDVIEQEHAEDARAAGRPATFTSPAWPEKAVRQWLRELAATGTLTAQDRISPATGKRLDPTRFALPPQPRRTP